MKFLITGGCGFLGSNLAEEVLRRGYQLVVFDNLYRTGSEKNLAWLQTLGEFTLIDQTFEIAKMLIMSLKKKSQTLFFMWQVKLP